MKERPTNMDAMAVRAVMEGRKTQMRWLVKPQPECFSHAEWPDQPDFSPSFNDDGSLCCGVCGGKQQCLTRRSVTGIRAPFGKAGDRLWVREKWWPAFRRTESSNGVVYYADYEPPMSLDPQVRFNKTWRPALEMTDIRVEQEGGVDAQAGGHGRQR